MISMYNTIISLFMLITCIFSNSLLNAVNKEEISTISTIETLNDISLNQPSQTIFFFDIDDSLIDFPYMLGSKAWRKYVVEATKNVDTSQDWHDLFTYILKPL